MSPEQVVGPWVVRSVGWLVGWLVPLERYRAMVNKIYFSRVLENFVSLLLTLKTMGTTF